MISFALCDCGAQVREGLLCCVTVCVSKQSPQEDCPVSPGEVGERAPVLKSSS